MTEVRNMEDLAKVQYLAITLQAQADKAALEFNGHIERYKDNLQGCMEWGSTLFKAAADNKLFAVLAKNCARRAEKEPDEIITLAGLRELVSSYWRYLNIVPSSTSASHNLASQYLAQA